MADVFAEHGVGRRRGKLATALADSAAGPSSHTQLHPDGPSVRKLTVRVELTLISVLTSVLTSAYALKTKPIMTSNF